MLGCSGSVAPGHRATSVQVGERLLVDAGCAASTLGPGEQAGLEDVLLTHAHLDHVHELPFLAEAAGARPRPLRVHGAPETLAALRAHLLNDAIHADWTRVPPGSPALALVPFAWGAPFEAGGLRVTAVPLPHPGGSAAFVLEDGDGALVWAGDTGAGDEPWATLRALGPRVRALAIEASFPDRLAGLAALTGHLTPRGVREGLASLAAPPARVLVHHVKPAHRAEVLADLARQVPGAHALADGETIELAAR